MVLVMGSEWAPLPLAAAVASVAVSVLILLRLASNNLTGNAPPVMEGIPFIGGLLKFIKVRADPLDPGRTSWDTPSV